MALPITHSRNSPAPLPGQFARVAVQYLYGQRGVCCYDCPPGYKRNPALNLDIALDDDQEFSSVLTAGFDGLGTPIYSYPMPNGSASLIMKCLRGDVQCWAAGTCKAAFVVMSSAPGGGPAGSDSEQFERADPCEGGTLGPWPGPHPPLTDDHKVLSGPSGPFVCGTSADAEVDISFRIVWNQAPASPTFLLGWARVTGVLCVPDEENPVDNTRYWCVMRRTHQSEDTGYAQLVAGNSKYTPEDRAPPDWLTGPHFRTWTPAMGPTPGHWNEVTCSPPQVFWRVDYQDLKADGSPVGPAYPGVHENASETEIVTVMERVSELPACTTDGRQDLALIDPGLPRDPTVETGVALNPVRVNPPDAVNRTRTYVDGPWPTQQLACLSAPDCPKADLGPPRPNYAFGGLRWVTNDWGRAAAMAEGTVFELDRYLRCRCGEDYKTPNEHGVITYGQKLCVRNIVGAMAETIHQDDDNDGDGFDHFLPAVLGEWNLGPGVPFGTRGGEPGRPGWAVNGVTPPWVVSGVYPSRWFVQAAAFSAGDNPLTVQEYIWIAWPSSWVGPATSAGYSTESEALAAAADIDGEWWCATVQDFDAEGNPVGPPYVGCMTHAQLPLPDPQPDPPMVRAIYGGIFAEDEEEGPTAQSYYREDMPVPAFSPNAGAHHSTIYLNDGPWVGVIGIGPDREQQCRANCPPCQGTPGSCQPPVIETFAAERVGPNTFQFHGGYSGSAAETITYDFGDGTEVSYTPDTLPEVVSHTYAADGVYAATVTVTNACGSDSAGAVVMTDGVMVSAPEGEPFISEPDGEPFIAQG